MPRPGLIQATTYVIVVLVTGIIKLFEVTQLAKQAAHLLGNVLANVLDNTASEGKTYLGHLGDDWKTQLDERTAKGLDTVAVNRTAANLLEKESKVGTSC